MMKLILFYFIIILTTGQPNFRQVLQKEKNFKVIWKWYGYGSMGNYKTPGELSRLCNKIVKHFPELVTRIELGKSYQNRTIEGYLFMKKSGDDFE